MAVEQVIDKLQSANRAKNIIIHGIEEKKIETTAELLDKAAELWKSLSITDVIVDDIFRIGKYQDGKSRPLIVKLVRTLDKKKIQQKAREISLHKKKIFINDDLTKQQQIERKLLREYLQASKQADNSITGSIRGNSLHLKKAGKVFKKLLVNSDGTIIDA